MPARSTLILVTAALGTALASAQPASGQSTPARAMQLNAAGDRAYDAGRYKEALDLYRAAFAAGSIEAEYSLGVQYQLGQGVRRDPNMAVKLLTAAANAGNAPAMARVAEMYLEPDGVPKNPALARKWASAAAKRGNAKGASLLGYMFDNGDGEPKDKCAALRWYRKADAGGVHAGDVFLGTIYAAGQCGQADWTKARFHFKRAIRDGNGVQLARISLNVLDRFERENTVRAYGEALMAGVQTFVSTLASSDGNSGSASGDNARFDMWVQKNRQQGLNDNGTPK